MNNCTHFKSIVRGFLCGMLVMMTAGTLVGQPCNLSVTLTKTNPTCWGDCDGMISANVSNGTGPYTYMWSNGETTASIDNLCAGAYTVMVTDANQCMDSVSTSISKGKVGGNVAVTNSTCGACNGMLVATGTGGNGAPYTYMWNTGATTNVIDNLCPGTYTVTITDDEGCTFVCTKVIGNGAFTVNETINHDTSCVANQCSGSINVSISPGPQSNYTFMWSTGATTAMINQLCAGNYTVTVTNNSGCSMTETYMVQDMSNCGGCNLMVTLNKTNPTCHGDCDGHITANPSNGTGPFTYVWSNGATTQMISNLCAGIYTVTVTDANQCTATAQATIAKGPVGANVTIVHETCGLCNGMITVTGNGGNGAPYTYLWSTGATTNSIDSLCAGTYSVTITDDEGCTYVCVSTIVNNTSNCNGCNDDFTTYTQGGWGNPGAPGQYMAANFASCFGSVTIGDACGYTLTLTSVTAVQDFLPQGGTPAALTQNYTDPGSGNITVLAGQLLAAHFAIGFDACDPNLSGSPSAIADQIYIDSNSVFYGWSIQAIHDTAMRVLAGCPSAYTPSEVNDALTAFNENYDNGGNNGNFACPDDTGNVTNPHIDLANVYPIPFSDVFMLDTKYHVGLKVTVSDMTGKVLKTYQNVTGLKQISGDFKKGIYLITIEDPKTGARQLIRTISVE